MQISGDDALTAVVVTNVVCRSMSKLLNASYSHMVVLE